MSAVPSRPNNDYELLNRVLDAEVSGARTADHDRQAQQLVDRGYLYRDETGRLRLSETGKSLVRHGRRD